MRSDERKARFLLAASSFAEYERYKNAVMPGRGDHANDTHVQTHLIKVALTLSLFIAGSQL